MRVGAIDKVIEVESDLVHFLKGVIGSAHEEECISNVLLLVHVHA